MITSKGSRCHVLALMPEGAIELISVSLTDLLLTLTGLIVFAKSGGSRGRSIILQTLSSTTTPQRQATATCYISHKTVKKSLAAQLMASSQQVKEINSVFIAIDMKLLSEIKDVV